MQPGRRTSPESSVPQKTAGQSDGSVLDPRAIAGSSVHYDFVSGNGGGLSDDLGGINHSHSDAGSYAEPAGLTRERIINYAKETYGVSEEWVIWLIGTTWNEGYQQDRYLEYCWACEIINEYRNYSVWDLDGIWGAYYSYLHAYSGYLSADDMTLQMVWEALTNTDTRIVEVDGMIRWEVPGYYLIYDSDAYNCQVWGN